LKRTKYKINFFKKTLSSDTFIKKTFNKLDRWEKELVLKLFKFDEIE